MPRAKKRLKLDMTPESEQTQHIESAAQDDPGSPVDNPRDDDGTSLLGPIPDELSQRTGFANKKLLLDALSTWAIRARFQYKLTDSNRSHMGWKCSKHESEGCPWRLRAACKNPADGSFRIATHVPHSAQCAPVEMSNARHAPVTIEWIRMRIMPLLDAKPDITCHEIMMALRLAHGAELEYHRVYRSLRKAKKAKEQGEKPRDWMETRMSTGASCGNANAGPRAMEDALADALGAANSVVDPALR